MKLSGLQLCLSCEGSSYSRTSCVDSHGDPAVVGTSPSGINESAPDSDSLLAESNWQRFLLSKLSEVVFGIRGALTLFICVCVYYIHPIKNVAMLMQGSPPTVDSTPSAGTTPEPLAALPTRCLLTAAAQSQL